MSENSSYNGTIRKRRTHYFLNGKSRRIHYDKKNFLGLSYSAGNGPFGPSQDGIKGGL